MPSCHTITEQPSVAWSEPHEGAGARLGGLIRSRRVTLALGQEWSLILCRLPGSCAESYGCQFADGPPCLPRYGCP
jgi:hypothetical protein